MANNKDSTMILVVLLLCCCMCCCFSSVMVPGSYYGYLKSVVKCFASDSEECKLPDATGISSIFGFSEMIGEKCVENADKTGWDAQAVTYKGINGTLITSTKDKVCNELVVTETTTDTTDAADGATE